MRVRRARSAGELEGLRPIWEHLQAAGQYTLFQSYGWNHLAARVFAEREAPWVVWAEGAGGAALVPAGIGSGQLGLLGEKLFDYRDVLTAGDAGEALAAAWRELARLGLPLSVCALRGPHAEAWRGFPQRFYCDAPCVPAAGLDGQRFAASHARSARFFRRLQRQGAELRYHGTPGQALVRWIYERKAEQLAAQRENLFADPRRAEFMVAAATLSPPAVEVFTLETAGSVVAALVTLRDGGTRRFYTTWFDRRWSQHSPGTALLFEITRRSLDEGLDCDYMTGSQGHKQRFATARVPLFRVEVTAGELAGVAAKASRVVVAA